MGTHVWKLNLFLEYATESCIFPCVSRATINYKYHKTNTLMGNFSFLSPHFLQQNCRKNDWNLLWVFSWAHIIYWWEKKIFYIKFFLQVFQFKFPLYFATQFKLTFLKFINRKPKEKKIGLLLYWTWFHIRPVQMSK